MPLVKGTVSVTPAGVAVGAGLALDLYNDEVAAYPGFAADLSAQGIAAKQTIAAKCNAWANRIDAFVKSATVAGVAPSGGGPMTSIIT